MDNKTEDICYGLDIANNHDTGVIAFKFLDTDKVIQLTQLELSILANYILDQYTTTDINSSLDVIKNIGNRLNILESNLMSQLSEIRSPTEVDVDKLLIELGKGLTNESRDNLDKQYPDSAKSMLHR